MISRLTPTLGICIVAAVVTGALLFRSADEPPAGVDAYGEPTETADDATDATDASEIDADITIAEFAFGDSITVSTGESVGVVNADGVFHTLTANDGEFDTGALDKDGTAAFDAPGEAGTYSFFCSIHPSMMGELIVE